MVGWYNTKTIYKNDYQPRQLSENVSFEMSSCLPEKIYIQSARKQVMKKRTYRFVLRHYLPSKVLSPTKYAHSLLILFFPFSSVSQLLKGGTYCDRLQELNVLDTVRRNHRKFDQHIEIIDSLCMQIQKNANDLNRVMFTETSSPGNKCHCSQEPSNDSR